MTNFFQLPLDCLKYLTRVHYKASSNEKWGEHEIDYVLFAQRDVDININLNEVSQVKVLIETSANQNSLVKVDQKVVISPGRESYSMAFIVQLIFFVTSYFYVKLN